MIIKEADNFKKAKKKIDRSYFDRTLKLVKKVVSNPEIGKPMTGSRKGTREVYLKPFRLSYVYDKKEDVLIFLDIYNKDRQ